MKKFLNLSIFIFIIFALFNSFSSIQAQVVDSSKHKLSIDKVDKKWKVVDKQKKVKKEVKVKKGDSVTWVSDSSDVYFQFNDENLFGTYYAFLEKGDSLSLTVQKKAKKGKYYYSAFIYNDKAYLEGNSPPQIIVD